MKLKLLLAMAFAVPAWAVPFNRFVLRDTLAAELKVALHCADGDAEVFHQSLKPILRSLAELRRETQHMRGSARAHVIGNVIEGAIAEARRSNPMAMHRGRWTLASRLAWEAHADPGSWNERVQQLDADFEAGQTAFDVAARVGVILHLALMSSAVAPSASDPYSLSAGAVLADIFATVLRAHKARRERRAALGSILQHCQRALLG